MTAPLQLTQSEEITLRRVAFGESPPHTLPAGDLARLRTLRLIMSTKDGLALTTTGRAHYDTLPKAGLRSRTGEADLARSIHHELSRKRP